MAIACLLPVLVGVLPCLVQAQDERSRAVMGEDYVFRNVADKASDPAARPASALEQAVLSRRFSVAEALDPDSRAWAGAQGLALTFKRPETLLISGVLASAGDCNAAAAVLSSGSIRLLGPNACPVLSLPRDRLAYALALSASGSVLAAWDQAAAELVFFDLQAPGCPSTQVAAPLLGQAVLALSPSGAFLAAQDASGAIWAGPRGGPLKHLATLSGQAVVMGFSEAEGVLLVLDIQGRGGAWNPRNGEVLRRLEIPGGPFAHGSFARGTASLFTHQGRLVRWNVLHNKAVEEAVAETGAVPGEGGNVATGWLEQRGQDLYYVGTRPAWQAEPVYEPRLPQLAWSRRANGLRLSDVDGEVRYYDAATGRESLQRLADDWVPVAIGANGRAAVAGLELRVFEQLPRQGGVPESSGGDRQINVRAVSETSILLWTSSPPDNDIRIQVSVDQPPTQGRQSATSSQTLASQPHSAKEPQQTVTFLYRLGLAADAPVRVIRPGFTPRFP